MTDPWLETFTFYLKPGCRLLDLGAGTSRAHPLLRPPLTTVGGR